MNKRGIALVFGLLVLLVLGILSSAFFIKTINENNFVKRHIGSMRALWVAETGVAEAKKRLPLTPTNGNLGSYSYQATTSYRTTIGESEYYDIVSTGTVPLSAGGNITRTVNVVVKRGPVDVRKFPYAINAANDLCFGGNCKKPAENYLDPDVCDGHVCWKENDTTINFRDLFGVEQNDMKSLAIERGSYYTNANFPSAVSGVSWVDVAGGSTLKVAGNLTGTGLLIVNGNVHFSGNYDFKGIVYILGTLTATGTFDSWGTIIVANTAGVDNINGNPTLHWDQEEIRKAIPPPPGSIQTVSWKESP